jgi:UDP-N-acetylmuramoylalanine-D-glutamate ligase
MNVKLGSNDAEIIYIDTIHDLKEKIRSLVNVNQVFLFSCGGSSFSDFNNYQERGDFFKELVISLEINDG